ncbi:hypothetical protein [Burkholderia ubonensis]|uniref:hypothetical protein n=1 Tax=Burkholderia ubonensis TaxID=101571 RepID=UPI000AB7177B|nr:hypothetical protein [Burkholderia ubonensis]
MQKVVKVGFSASPELRQQAIAAADDIGVPLAEYMRMAIIHLVKHRTNPFTERSDVRMGRPPVKVSL